MQKLVKLLKRMSRQPVRALVQGGVGEQRNGGTVHRVLGTTSSLLCERARKWQNWASNSGPSYPTFLPVDSPWHGLLLPLC